MELLIMSSGQNIFGIDIDIHLNIRKVFLVKKEKFKELCCYCHRSLDSEKFVYSTKGY